MEGFCKIKVTPLKTFICHCCKKYSHYSWPVLKTRQKQKTKKPETHFEASSVIRAVFDLLTLKIYSKPSITLQYCVTLGVLPAVHMLRLAATLVLSL